VARNGARDLAHPARMRQYLAAGLGRLGRSRGPRAAAAVHCRERARAELSDHAFLVDAIAAACITPEGGKMEACAIKTDRRR
jgi:hypothetical protein